MKKIPLTQGYEAIVDDEDYEELLEYSWCVIVGTRGRVYAKSSCWDKDKRKYVYFLMHRFLTKAPKGLDVDHKNHNSLDNRRQNLRLCTRSQNLANKRVFKPHTSQFRGVFLDKSKKAWRASLTHKSKMMWLGSFKTEAEASTAYNLAATKIYGEFATLNEVPQ